MQIFRINTNHSFIPKIHYARKTKYEPLKVEKSKVCTIQRAHILYHVSTIVIQNFILAITWYKIHNGDCTSIFQVEKLSKLIYYLIQINKARNNTH